MGFPIGVADSSYGMSSSYVFLATSLIVTCHFDTLTSRAVPLSLWRRKPDLFSAVGTSPLYPEIVPGQQAAWRSHSVDFSRARSHLVPAFSPPSSVVVARTYLRGTPFSGAGESRSRGAVAAISRHATSIRLMAVGNLVFGALRARWVLSSSTCTH